MSSIDSRIDDGIVKVGAYIGHTFFAMAGVLMLGLSVARFLVSASIISERVAGRLFEKPPLYLGEVAIGLIIGFVVNHIYRTRLAMWTWVAALQG